MMRIDTLPNQGANETVVLFLRRHWMDLVRIAFFTFFLLLIPLAIYAFLWYFQIPLLDHPILGPIITLSSAIYLLVVYLITITEITDYWLDVWLVTTERVINIEQHGLFNRLISEVGLDLIQDITSETKGLLETFLTYGDVYVQSAGEKVRFRFKNVDNPDEVKLQISALVTACQTKHVHSHPEVGLPKLADQNKSHL